MIYCVEYSYVNLRLGWNSIKQLRKSWSFPSPWVHRKKMSSIYLSQTQRFKFYVVKKSVSNLSINMHTYGGANFVPMAVPEICCFIFESNSKKLFFRTNLAICRRSSVAILLSSRSSNLADNASAHLHVEYWGTNLRHL